MVFEIKVGTDVGFSGKAAHGRILNVGVSRLYRHGIHTLRRRETGQTEWKMYNCGVRKCVEVRLYERKYVILNRGEGKGAQTKGRYHVETLRKRG